MAGEITYIMDNIIVIGLPQTEEQVQKYSAFLNRHHGGAYLIWNLSKSTYPYGPFSDQVVEIWQPPHSHQTLDLLFLVCQQVESWLKANKNRSTEMEDQGNEAKHIAVFHSNSKNPGRLNMVLSCVLAYLGVFDNAHESCDMIIERRGQVNKETCLPSHRRYLSYFSDMLNVGMVRIPNPRPLKLARLIMYPFPDCGDSTAVFQIVKGAEVLFESDNLVGEGEEIGAFKVLQVNTILKGDIVFACKILPAGPSPGELLFRYAFHQGFTSPAPVRITGAKLDAPQERLDPDFFMDLVFDTPGEESESDEEDWDDGLPLQALRLIGRRNKDRGAIAELERDHARKMHERKKREGKLEAKGIAEQAREAALQRNARRRQMRRDAGEDVGPDENGNEHRLLTPTLGPSDDGESPTGGREGKPASAFDLACSAALPRAPKGLTLRGSPAAKGAKGKGKGKGGKAGPPPRGANGEKGGGKGAKGGVKGGRGDVDPNAPKMRQIHWDTVGDHAIQTSNSIFNELQEIDLSTLEGEIGELFELKKAQKKEVDPAAEAKAKGPQKANIVSGDRGKNIEIRISQFKKMGHDALFQLVKNMDPQAELSVEQLEALLRCAPLPEEKKSLLEFAGKNDELSNAEIFLRRACKSDQFEDRLKVMRVVRLFDHEARLISEQVVVMKRGIDEVLKATKLGGVFEIVLALGNQLNKKKANGFRVGSLLKLVETKSNKTKVTMLHYLASVIESRMAHLMDFGQELPSLSEAAGISIDNVATTFTQLQGLTSP